MSQPLHIGIIPDGGRRWAKIRDVPLASSYVRSVELLSACILEWFGSGHRSVSVYILSKDNLKRPPAELNAILSATEAFLRSISPVLESEYNVGTRIVGDLGLLDAQWQRLLDLTGPPVVNAGMFACIAYDPFQELSRVIRQGGQREEGILARLQMPYPIDVVIRTGGANTLSRFLPLQSSYANLVFLDELFNDCTLDDLSEIVGHYSQQRLKYGE